MDLTDLKIDINEFSIIFSRIDPTIVFWSQLDVTGGINFEPHLQSRLPKQCSCCSSQEAYCMSMTVLNTVRFV